LLAGARGPPAAHRWRHKARPNHGQSCSAQFPLSGRLLGWRQNLAREPPPLQIVAARAHRAPASTPRIAAESPIRRSSPSATRAESHWESPPRSSIQKFLYGPLVAAPERRSVGCLTAG